VTSRPSEAAPVGGALARAIYLAIVAASASAVALGLRRALDALHRQPSPMLAAPGVAVAAAAFLLWALVAALARLLVSDPRVRAAARHTYPLLPLAPPVGYALALLLPLLPRRATSTIARSRRPAVALGLLALAGGIWIDTAAPRLDTGARTLVIALAVLGTAISLRRPALDSRLWLGLAVVAYAVDGCRLSLPPLFLLAWTVSPLPLLAPALLLARRDRGPGERLAIGVLPAATLILAHVYGWYTLPARPFSAPPGVTEIYRSATGLGAWDNRFLVDGLEPGTFLVGTKEEPHALSLLRGPASAPEVWARGQTGDNGLVDRDRHEVVVPFYEPSEVCRWHERDPPRCVTYMPPTEAEARSSLGFSVVRGNGRRSFTIAGTRWLCAIHEDAVSCFLAFDAATADLAVTATEVWASGGGALFRCTDRGHCTSQRIFAHAPYAISDFVRGYLASDGSRLWMTDNLTGDLAEISIADQKVTRRLHLARGIRNLAYDANRQLVYVANEVTGDLSAVDLESFAVRRTWQLGRRLRWPELDGGGSRLLVTSAAGGFAIDLDRALVP